MLDFIQCENQNSQNEPFSQPDIFEDEIIFNQFYMNELYRQINQSANSNRSFSNFEQRNGSENHSSLLSKNESQFSNFSQSFLNSENKNEKINHSSLFSKDEVSQINRLNNNSQSSVNSEESSEIDNILNCFYIQSHISIIKLFIEKKRQYISNLNSFQMEKNKIHNILNNVNNSNKLLKLEEFNQKNKENLIYTGNNVVDNPEEITEIKEDNLTLILLYNFNNWILNLKDKYLNKIKKLNKINIQCLGKETKKIKNKTIYNFIILFLVMMYNYNRWILLKARKKKKKKKKRNPNILLVI